MDNTFKLDVFQLFPPIVAKSFNQFISIEFDGYVDRAQGKFIDSLGGSLRVLIDADPLRGKHSLRGKHGPDPRDFDQPTLAWALRDTSLVVIRAGEPPVESETIANTLSRHSASPRIVVILACSATRDSWLRCVAQLSGTGTEMLLVRHAGNVVSGEGTAP